jgi:hypothetical protein
MEIIGIAGQARMGKDTLGKFLLPVTGEWQMTSFAFQLKHYLSDLLRMEIDTLEEWKLKNEKPDGLQMTMRKTMQHFGDSMRCIDPDIWIKATFRNAVKNKIIITDVRYENEISYLKQRKAFLILIGNIGKLNYDTAPSESYLRDVTEYMLKNTSEDIHVADKHKNNDQMYQLFCNSFDIFIRNETTLEALKNIADIIKSKHISK